MKRALPLALLLSACPDDPPVTFGLNFRFLESDIPAEEQANAWCLPPGQSHGSTSASSINIAIGDTPPHLFIEAAPDGKQDVYRVRLYTAAERDADDFWWVPSEVLAERSYDSEFGQRGEQDSIVVDFEGQQYTVEVLGLPAAATCPLE